MDTIDITLLLQIVTLIIAALAPFLAYRHSRKLFISEGRQAWINDLRSDLAELIAAADIAATIYQTKDRDDMLERYRTTMHNVQTLRMRIRLRLERDNPRHARLVGAMEDLLGSVAAAGQERDKLRSELLEAAETTLQHVWRQLEKGKR